MDSEKNNILPTVSKPTRYQGNELNAIRKNIDDPEIIRFALAFPDIYDVGMSHLGLKILYQILNSRNDVYAERVYTPWIDMEEKMRKKGIPLSSLESDLPLREFDIIGFSLQYEMSYTNLLNMLDLAGIPLLAAERDSRYPLIIAGGPCAFNPEPLAEFIDIFVIGDGEEIITEIVDCYKIHKEKKRDLLNNMADIEGVYVPSLASMEKQADGTLTVASYRGKTGKDALVKKRTVNDLDNASYPIDYLVPFMRTIHDRAVIEIMRGCSRGCRFCQAGMIYRPVRERSPQIIESLAREIIDKTGYEELSLSSLSTCDHSSIYEIIHRLVESLGKNKHVSISLPSLRADAFSVEIARELDSVGKTGLTFAPEVATERMQNVVNKPIPPDDILSTVKSAFKTGWDSLKLYFMIGLPTETEEDITNIAALVKRTLQVAVSINKRASLNVSISTFVPKAHTPFQWERQASLEEIRQKQRLLLDRVGRNRRINVSFHSPEVSFLEGVFARGDRRLGQVLLTAHKLGCKMDGWTECFNFNAWTEAFQQCGIDPTDYLKARDPELPLPWDHIDTYLTKSFLLSERNKAYKAEQTPDCRWGNCSGCGICSKDSGREMRLSSQTTCDLHPEFIRQKTESDTVHPVSKVRFRFTKSDEVKFISHLDMLNAFTRAFRRAGIPIAYSHGFNPHPKISFGSTLPVGTISRDEFADIELESYLSPEDFVKLTNRQLPEGMKILTAREIPLKSQSLMSQVNMASYVVYIPKLENHVESRIQSILDMDHIWIERSYKRNKRSRKSGTKSKPSKFIDVKPLIGEIKLLSKGEEYLEIEMLLSEGEEGKVRPEEIIHLIFNETTDYRYESILSQIDIQKTGSFIEDQGRLFSPMEIINGK
jgi:radical SAM family uncharacterized protein/radical SAM-linked protein